MARNWFTFTAGALSLGFFIVLAVPSVAYAGCSGGFLGLNRTCGGGAPYSVGGGCVAIPQPCKTKWYRSKCTPPPPIIQCSPTSLVQEAESSGSSRSLNSGSCLVGTKLCGLNCIPEGSVCCATAGYPDRFCPVGSTCTTKGQCEVGGSYCTADKGKVCSSALNSCGKASVSSYLCDGTCPVVSPSDASCPVPNISLSVSPRFVNRNAPCTINWVVSEITSCTLTGPGVSTTISPSNASGSTQTPPIVSSQTYTLKCANGSVVRKEQSVTCQLNPTFREI